jgi:hypothetical protein
MITQISYNVLIERFRAFASGHYLIEAFTHGELSQTDLEKDQRFPWMHVFPVEVEPRQGSRLYTFVVTFADLPRDKETAAEYQRESLSDCIKLAEDLLAEIQNGLVLFGPTVELEGSATIEPFIKEFTHTLTGVNLTLTISVPWNWDACDIPADFTVGGSGSGGSGSGGGGILLETNGVVNGDQTLLNLQEGANITLVDNGFGTVTISVTGGADDVATEFNVNHTTATGNQYVIGDRVYYLGNIYQCIANNDALLPTNTLYWSLLGPGFRLRQTPVDWDATSGDFQILNKPTIPVNLDDLGDVNTPSPTNGQVLTWNGTAWINNTPASGGSVTSVALTVPAAFSVTGSPITTAGTLAVSAVGTIAQYIRGNGTLATFPTIPAAQVNSDWAATSGVAEILNKPTIPAAQVNSDWAAVGGVAEILNKPTIPTTLDSLTNVNVPSPSNAQVLQYDTASSQWIAATPSGGGTGTVTSVALTMPSAFTVGGSPVTTAGTLAVSAAGLATQYVRGDGQLANFPTTSGGGSSVSYYLNGSINQGTIGGSTYYQMSKTAIFGAGTDFTRTNAAGNGLIAQFITDTNDPNVLLIPGGNFNLELYFSASSGGGSPSFYVELYKYDGAAFTLLATDVATPEGITNGTTIDAYFTALAVPATVMTLTDRLALRVFVTTSGRTLKLHTENGHLSQVITTLSTGVNAINGLTAQVQNLAVGTAGTDFAISSAGSTHTFNLPTASAANRGALSSADWSTFNGKQNAIGLTTVGTNLATLPDPSAVRFLRINSDNTVTARTAAEMVSDLGIGGGSISVLFQSQNASTIPASSTYFGCLFGGAPTIVSADTVRRTPMVTSGTLTRLYVQTSGAQPATGSLVCTVRKNSADQALTLTIAAGSAAGVFTDLVNAVSVAAGDQMGMKFQNNATTVSGNVLTTQVLLTI